MIDRRGLALAIRVGHTSGRDSPSRRQDPLATVPSLGRADASPANAVNRLYEEYSERVHGYCLYRLGSREEAEDAAQQTFLYALRALERGTVPQAEAAWLFTIAKNVCLARYRTRGRRGRLEVLSDPQALADARPSPDGGEDGRLRLEDALTRIPEQQRRAILLREWRGLSYREIAEALGVSVAAVETLVFRARRSLAELLREEEDARPRRLRAFDLGSLAAAAKSLLGGASAAKLAAGAAAVVAVVAAVPSSEPAAEPSAPVPVPALGRSAGPAAATERPLARPLPTPSAERRAVVARGAGDSGDRAGVKKKAKPSANDPAQTRASAAKPAGEAPPADDPGLVNGATGPLDGAVEETGLPLDVEVPGLPVPEAEVPEVPVPEVEVPELPAPEVAVPRVAEVVEEAADTVTGALPPAPPLLP